MKLRGCQDARFAQPLREKFALLSRTPFVDGNSNLVTFCRRVQLSAVYRIEVLQLVFACDLWRSAVWYGLVNDVKDVMG